MSNNMSAAKTKWPWGQKNGTTPFSVSPQTSSEASSTTVGIAKQPNPFVSSANTWRQTATQNATNVFSSPFTDTTHEARPCSFNPNNDAVSKSPGSDGFFLQAKKSAFPSADSAQSAFPSADSAQSTQNGLSTNERGKAIAPFNFNNASFPNSNSFVSDTNTGWPTPAQSYTTNLPSNAFTATTKEPRPNCSNRYSASSSESPASDGFFLEAKRSAFPSVDLTQSTQNGLYDGRSKATLSFSTSSNPVSDSNSAAFWPFNVSQSTEQKQSKPYKGYTDQPVGVASHYWYAPSGSSTPSAIPASFVVSSPPTKSAPCTSVQVTNNNNENDIVPILHSRGESLDHAFAVALDQLNRASQSIAQAAIPAQKEKKHRLDKTQQVEQLLTESFHAFRSISDYALWRDGQPHATAFYNMACCLSLAVELQIIMSQQDSLSQMLNMYGNVPVSDFMASKSFAVPSLFHQSKAGSRSTTLKESTEQHLRACDSCLKVAVAAGWHDLAHMKTDRDLKVYAESINFGWMTKLAV